MEMNGMKWKNRGLYGSRKEWEKNETNISFFHIFKVDIKRFFLFRYVRLCLDDCVFRPKDEELGSENANVDKKLSLNGKVQRQIQFTHM